MKKVFFFVIIILFIFSLISFVGHSQKTSSFTVITNDGYRITSGPVSLPPLMSENTKLEFKERTNKWFSSLKFYYSSGYIKPGSDVSLEWLQAFNSKLEQRVDDQLQIHFKLTQRDQEWQLVDTVNEQTFYLRSILSEDFSFKARLSEKEGTRYILSVEIIGESGIEDTFLAAIYVPMPVLESSLNLNKREYLPSETLMLTISNEGSSAVSLSSNFKLERLYNNTTWFEYPIEIITIQQYAIELYPGWSCEQNIPLYSLDVGKYRVIKTIWGVGTDLKKDLVETFIVQK